MFICGAICGFCGIEGAYVELVPFACLACAPKFWPPGFPTKDPSLKNVRDFDCDDDVEYAEATKSE